MRQEYRNKTIAILFSAFLAFFAIGTIVGLAFKVLDEVTVHVQASSMNNNVQDNKEESKENFENIPTNKTVSQKLKSVVKTVEDMYNENIYLKDLFVNFYGTAQKLMSKKIRDELVLDNKGYMQNPAEFVEVETTSHSLIELSNYVESLGSQFLHFQPGSKVIEGFTSLPNGIEDYSNDNINRFLKNIEEEVPYLDYREVLPDDLSSVFYKTDHHWRVETAFDAAKKTLENLSEKGFYFENLKQITNLENYSLHKIEDNFLGSQGNKVSASYAGIDDFSVLTPKFDTSYELTQILKDNILHIREGNFTESLLYPELIEPTKDTYSIESYAAYLGYGNTEKHIINNNVTNDYKVLVIGDSFSRPYAAFLSLAFKETRNFDTQPGRFQGDVYEYIKEYQPDIVISLFNENALGDSQIFNFLKK